MKNLIQKKLFTIVCLCFNLAVFAQPTNPVAELRALMESSKTNFKDEIAEKRTVTPVNGYYYYNTKRKTEFAVTDIMENEKSGIRSYIINYPTDSKVSTDNLMAVLKVVPLYMTELNQMVKSGEYTGSDSTDENGNSLTTILDKNGRTALIYKSNNDTQSLYIFNTERVK